MHGVLCPEAVLLLGRSQPTAQNVSQPAETTSLLLLWRIVEKIDMSFH